MNLRTVATAVLLACLSGCLSFGGEDADDIATNGADYTTNTRNLIDEAIRASNHDSSQELLDSKVRADLKARPEYSKEVMFKQLEDLDKGLIIVAGQAYDLKASLDAVNQYFIGLQALVRDPTAERNAEAVRNLGYQVDRLNSSMEGRRGGPLIGHEKTNALAELTGVISDQVKAKKVRQAVQRDAETIAKALALQGKSLDWAETVIYSDLTNMNERFYKKNVKEHYAEQGDNFNQRWVDDRLLYLEARTFIDNYNKRKAYRDPKKHRIELWSSALSMSYDQTIISQQILDIHALIAIKAKIEKAYKR